MPSLRDLDVLVVDCQATAAAPRGHLLELAWARAGATMSPARSCLIQLPGGQRIPPGVARITGLSDSLMKDGVPAPAAWQQLASEAARLPQPAATVIHFARFETPFLRTLAGGEPPLDVVCTHAIARRLLPDLPRCSLRALAGYFGHGVHKLRRGSSHVEATVFVWRALIPLLEAQDVTTWNALRQWLARPAAARKPRHRVWPLARDIRLAVPDVPGIYRMHRTNGDVLYVGKAASLHHRVNSYFQKQSRIPERMLEMLSQARALSVEAVATPLEAALRETDEIKRLQPPYNIALGLEERQVWFASGDLGENSTYRSPRCPLGPFPSSEILAQFAALAQAHPSALGVGRWSPTASVFAAGYQGFCEANPEMSRHELNPQVRLLQVGTRLWREGRHDRADDQEREERSSARTPEQVQAALEWIALGAALARRRARWLTHLVDAALIWTEPRASGARLIVIEHGDIAVQAPAERDAVPPVPSGWRRSTVERREAFTIERLDRLRVLTTELKRLVAADANVSLRLSSAPPLSRARLVRALSWV